MGAITSNASIGIPIHQITTTNLYAPKNMHGYKKCTHNTLSSNIPPYTGTGTGTGTGIGTGTGKRAIAPGHVDMYTKRHTRTWEMIQYAESGIQTVTNRWAIPTV